MQFLFRGFRQKLSLRRFVFEGIEGKHDRKRFVVATDLELFTKHNVHLQEGPIMCLHLLEATNGGDPPEENLVLTESDIVNHVRAKEAIQATALSRRKRFARPPKPA